MTDRHRSFRHWCGPCAAPIGLLGMAVHSYLRGFLLIQLCLPLPDGRVGGGVGERLDAGARTNCLHCQHSY